MQISERWQHVFLDVAKAAQKASKDPSTKVGCAVYRGKELLCMGFNGLPEAIPDDPIKLADREWKNKHTIHAEINALNRYKGSLQGCGIVTTFLPCSDCAQSIIDRGIKTVYYIKASPEAEERWAESFKASKQKFEKAGVNVFEIKQV